MPCNHIGARGKDGRPAPAPDLEYARRDLRRAVGGPASSPGVPDRARRRRHGRIDTCRCARDICIFIFWGGKADALRAVWRGRYLPTVAHIGREGW